MSDTKIIFYKLSFWKKLFIPKMILLLFKLSNRKSYIYINNLKQLERISLNNSDKIIIWGNKYKNELEIFKIKYQLDIISCEDGFIRSCGLGSNFVTPTSLVFDYKGIYYDCSKESDLEFFLNNHNYSLGEISLAKKIINKIIKNRISKYNVILKNNYKDLINNMKKKILVIGQVEDDDSVKYGTFHIKSNLRLLKTVRKKFKNYCIIYKPHPDVEVKNRKGNLSDLEVLKYADLIAKKSNILDILESVDSVHTMTSLAGFEALIRKKKVYVYGAPFYAGWGLTHDYYKDKNSFKRRVKRLSLEKLVYGALIYYNVNFSDQISKILRLDKYLDNLKRKKYFINQVSSLPKNLYKIKNITNLYLKEKFK
jgi:capsular polysaccharide export protein